MKSKFLVTALSAVALTACNNDEVMEVNWGHGISFQVTTEVSTRAAATTTNSIKEFKVWGFTDAGETLMDGLKATGSNADGWNYGATIFWPSTGTVDFYAMAPEECGGTVNVSSDAQTITDFTVNTDVTKQVDLLYALQTGESKADHESGATPVKLNFRHALSQIVFKAKNTNEHLSVDIEGVRVAKVVTGGDFTFPASATSTQLTDDPGTTDTESDNSWGEWTLGTEKGFYTAGITPTTGITSASGVKDLSGTDGALLLMPQKIEGWDISEDNTQAGADSRGTYFLVSCKIYNVSGDSKLLVWPAKDEYREVAIPATDITWKQGQKYVYTFIFGEGGGYVPPTDPTDPNPDPEDPETPGPGNPILVPVSFEVTVDDFQQGNDFPLSYDSDIDVDDFLNEEDDNVDINIEDKITQ